MKLATQNNIKNAPWSRILNATTFGLASLGLAFVLSLYINVFVDRYLVPLIWEDKAQIYEFWWSNPRMVTQVANVTLLVSLLGGPIAGYFWFKRWKVATGLSVVVMLAVATIRVATVFWFEVEDYMTAWSPIMLVVFAALLTLAVLAAPKVTSDKTEGV